MVAIFTFRDLQNEGESGNFQGVIEDSIAPYV